MSNIKKMNSAQMWASIAMQKTNLDTFEQWLDDLREEISNEAYDNGYQHCSYDKENYSGYED